MFDWLNETERAGRLESAIAQGIVEDKVRTYDIGGKPPTLDGAKVVADYAAPISRPYIRATSRLEPGP